MGAPFRFGQEVFVPWAHAYAEHVIPCPICAGQRSVTLILGSGEHVPVECQGCGLGFEGPRGYVTARRADSGIHHGPVTGMEQRGAGWRIVVANAWTVDSSEVFATADEAEPARRRLLAEAEDQAQRSFESQFKQNKNKHGWSVHYHRGEIARLERSLAWHREKLMAAKPKAWETPPC